MMVGLIGRSVAIAIALVVLLCHGPLARAEDGSVTFNIKSSTQYAVHLRFYARERDWVWPGNDQNYPITDSNDHSYSLTCQVGEKVCYGAWYINSGKY